MLRLVRRANAYARVCVALANYHNAKAASIARGQKASRLS